VGREQGIDLAPDVRIALASSFEKRGTVAGSKRDGLFH